MHGDQGGVTSAKGEFESAWRSHGRRLHAWIRGETGPGDDVDAIFQEVWLGYLRALRRGRAPRSPRAWLFATARNLVLKSRRRRTMRVLAEDPVARPTAPASANIEAAVERLSPTAREVFVLRVRMGLTYDEIAQVLGIRRGTVASRLHDAVTTLRRQLIGEGYCPPKWRGSR